MAQARHDARVRLSQALLNVSCLGPARQTRLIWSSIPPHGNDDHHLNCRHLVRHPSSFLSPLMSSHLHHPILDRGRESKRLLPVFIRHQPRHRPTQWLLHVHKDVSHHARAIVSPSSDIPFVFSVFALFFLTNLLPPSMVAVASRPMLVDAGTGESILLVAFLCACRQGGHGGACHA
jgi:hypothetical protein